MQPALINLDQRNAQESIAQTTEVDKVSRKVVELAKDGTCKALTVMSMIQRTIQMLVLRVTTAEIQTRGAQQSGAIPQIRSKLGKTVPRNISSPRWREWLYRNLNQLKV